MNKQETDRERTPLGEMTDEINASRRKREAEAVAEVPWYKQAVVWVGVAALIAAVLVIGSCNGLF